MQLATVVFAFAGVGQLLGLALIAITKGEMSAVLVVLPTLVFMLTYEPLISPLGNWIGCSMGRAAMGGV